MSVSSDLREALTAGLETALAGLTPPAEASPVPPAENANVTDGCAWIVKAPRQFDVASLGGPVRLNQTITYLIDFQCYREAPRHADAALAAQTRVDEMVDAFVSWLQSNPHMADGSALKALPVGTTNEAELEAQDRGWTAALQLRVAVDIRI